MAESESVLLQRFASAGDTVAYTEIVRRYAALVYGTCLCVLADADQAADATQETFFELTRKADPDDPQQRGKYEMKLWLQSLDPQAEMPVTSIEQTERGTSVAWQVTFKNDVTMEGHTFRAGDTWELDASLQRSGDSWLIDGL